MSKLREAYDRNNGGSGGLVCPYCGGRDFEVYRTEKTAINQIRRTRLCKSCGRKVPTVETVRKDD